MAARALCLIYLLSKAKKADDLRKRRQARELRGLRTISRDSDYIANYRLSEDLLNVLVEDISAYLPGRSRSTGLTKKLKILCTLSFLATGSYQKVVGKNVDCFVSQSSTSRAIHAVVNALSNPDIVKKYIRFPQNTSERTALKQSFYKKFKIPGVIGCIDGTLVALIRPIHNEERYYCRKGYHARNVMLITDANLNILHVDVTFGGATHDSFVFENSVIKEHLVRLIANGESVYLLGDSGYAQRPYLMTPFINPAPNSREEHYNNLHSSARNSVERTIGILKGRFRCLLVHRVLHYDPIMVGKIIIACCVLHNICNNAGIPAPCLSPREVTEEDSLIQILRNRNSSHELLADGRECRQSLINQLWRARTT